MKQGGDDPAALEELPDLLDEYDESGSIDGRAEGGGEGPADQAPEPGGD